MFLCPTHNFFSFDIGIPYLAHGSITRRGCIVYHQERMFCVHSWSQYDVDLWPEGQIYRVYDMALCSGHSFLSFDIGILCLAHECITMVLFELTFMASVWPWSLTSVSKLYFHHEIVSGKIVFALWHRHTKFWHLGVSPWDMLCTFLTFVWPGPLTNMWVARGFLNEYYSQLLSCLT